MTASVMGALVTPMSRTFYTERDIEDLVKRGVHEIEVNDSVYITDLGREKMEQLGVRPRVVPSGSARAATSPPQPAPAAVPPAQPVAAAAPPPAPAAASPAPPAPPPAHPASGSNGALSEAERQQVFEKVKSGVIARLGPGADAALVDKIVHRVVSQL